MRGTKLKALACALLSLAVGRGLLANDSVAKTVAPYVLRLAGRDLSVAAPRISATSVHGTVRAELTVTLNNTGRRSVAISRSDFALSAQADIFGVQTSGGGEAQVTVLPHRSHVLRLTFAVPRTDLEHANLFYRPLDRTASGTVPLSGPRVAADLSSRAVPGTSSTATINTFWVTQGVGEPWGTAVDSSGNIWFAEPGCDFAPTCAANTPPGQIGEITASSHAVVFYTLPNIPGNQPIFPAFDGSGKLWFSTPNNSMIGELNPSTGAFVGQWPVAAGSGPWDLTFAGGSIWYTEHLGSAVGSFDPATHAHRDFQTPSANSQPYGIAANGGQVWFTENNSNVDRVAVLNTKNNAISEYPIVLPTSGTPHLIAIDPNGHPWWTEGWSNTIATLNPAAATPGQCGTSSGPCNGIQRFGLPPATSCAGSGTHTSGIAFQSSANRVWLDNSLTAQVGSFDPSAGTFALNTLSNCNAHPHDGLSLDTAGHVWFDEEFANAIGELIP
jgi:streptogramin lyase